MKINFILSSIMLLAEQPPQRSAYSTKEILLIIACIVFVFFIAHLPVVVQRLLSNAIDDWKYKRIRLDRFSVFFRTNSGESVKRYGMVPSMFVIQLAGYILALCCVIVFAIFHIVWTKEQASFVSAVMFACLLGAEIIVDALVIILVSIRSKRKPSQYASRLEAEGYFYIRNGIRYKVIRKETDQPLIYKKGSEDDPDFRNK